jgi:hypothetical protein
MAAVGNGSADLGMRENGPSWGGRKWIKSACVCRVSCVVCVWCACVCGLESLPGVCSLLLESTSGSSSLTCANWRCCSAESSRL